MLEWAVTWAELLTSVATKGAKKTGDMHHTPSKSIHRKTNLAVFSLDFFSGACKMFGAEWYFKLSFVCWSLLIKESDSPSPFGSENLIIGAPCRRRAIFPRWRDLEYLYFEIPNDEGIVNLRVDTRLWNDLYAESCGVYGWWLTEMCF